MSGPIVIVDGGLAGQRCAETLRRCGCEEPIVMVCAEPHLPYDRPPLSKEVLSRAHAGSAPSFRARAQYVGHASLADGVSLDGDTATPRFSATFTRNDRPVAVLLAGRPQMLPPARALLADASGLTPA